MAWRNSRYRKYNNKKTTVNKQTFDSKREARRFLQLKSLEKAGQIFDLQCQVKFELIPKQDGERACNYIADFVYKDADGRVFVEDVKGTKTDVYKIKKKLMLYFHNIRIMET